jgi:hypothetical protein
MVARTSYAPACNALTNCLISASSRGIRCRASCRLTALARYTEDTVGARLLLATLGLIEADQFCLLQHMALHSPEHLLF